MWNKRRPRNNWRRLKGRFVCLFFFNPGQMWVVFRVQSHCPPNRLSELRMFTVILMIIIHIFFLYICILCLRLTFYKQRWWHSRRWYWRPRLPHRTASCIHSCSLRVPEDRSNTSATSGTRVPAALLQPHPQNQNFHPFPFSLWLKRTER